MRIYASNTTPYVDKVALFTVATEATFLNEFTLCAPCTRDCEQMYKNVEKALKRGKELYLESTNSYFNGDCMEKETVYYGIFSRAKKNEPWR